MINSVFQLYLIEKILQNIFSSRSTLSNSLNLWNIDALLSCVLLFITRYLIYNDRISFMHPSLWTANAVYGSSHKTYICLPLFLFFFPFTFLSYLGYDVCIKTYTTYYENMVNNRTGFKDRCTLKWNNHLENIILLIVSSPCKFSLPNTGNCGIIQLCIWFSKSYFIFSKDYNVVL